MYGRFDGPGVIVKEDKGILISYFRAEAGGDARLLHNRLEVLTGRRVFFDASSAHDVSAGVNAHEIADILEQVRRPSLTTCQGVSQLPRLLKMLGV